MPLADDTLFSGDAIDIAKKIRQKRKDRDGGQKMARYGEGGAGTGALSGYDFEPAGTSTGVLVFLLNDDVCLAFASTYLQFT